MTTPTPTSAWPTLIHANIWHLDANPEAVRAAADAWGAMARKVLEARDGIDNQALPLRGDRWSGTAADSYHAHRTAVGLSVNDTAAAARTAQNALHAAAGALTSAQGALTASLSRLRAGARTIVFGPVLWVQPGSPQALAAVRALIGDARGIRADLDDALEAAAHELQATTVALTRVASHWGAVAESIVPGWVPPAESTRLTCIDDGEQIVVSTGSGDDEVQVRVDPATGAQIVVVNGRTLTFPAGRTIVIRTGSGADRVSVAQGTSVRLTILTGAGDDWVSGGSGDDRISTGDGSDVVRGQAGNDRIYGGAGTADNLYAGAGDDMIVGGAGMDHVDAGDGNDRVSGGTGADTVYGMSGNDTMIGGAGRDYLEGARDDDAIVGGAGQDVVSGGRGADALNGGSGADLMYGGRGIDTVHGDDGSDTAYLQNEDSGTAEHEVYVDVSDAGSFIRVEGSPEFVTRVEADLDMLRASPTGQEMLSGLDKARDDSDGWFTDGDGLRIDELADTENGYAIQDSSWGSQTHEIRYNPSFDSLRGGTPPVVVLYHEMAHVWDYSHDTVAPGVYTGADNPGVNNRERVAAGLPIDHDDDSSTHVRLDPDHPYVATENALREEIGLVRRDAY